MKAKTRAEHDYWLRFAPVKKATEAEREEFLRFDSQGGSITPSNPVYMGKVAHGMTGEVLRDARRDTNGGWVGGLDLLADYAPRHPFGLRSLREWFGDEVVREWCRAIWKEVRP